MKAVEWLNLPLDQVDVLTIGLHRGSGRALGMAQRVGLLREKLLTVGRRPPRAGNQQLLAGESARFTQSVVTCVNRSCDGVQWSRADQHCQQAIQPVGRRAEYSTAAAICRRWPNAPAVEAVLRVVRRSLHSCRG